MNRRTGLGIAMVPFAPAAQARCAVADPGHAGGRLWYDFLGSGADGYCRVVGDPGQTFAQGRLPDMGHHGTWLWRDLGGTRAFCREVGDRPRTFVLCSRRRRETRSFGDDYVEPEP